MKWLLKRLQGLGCHLREHPAAIWLCSHPVAALSSDSPAIPRGPYSFAEQPFDNDRYIGHRIAITWHEGIQIDEVSNALRYLINHASDDHPGIAVTYQDDTTQI